MEIRIKPTVLVGKPPERYKNNEDGGSTINPAFIIFMARVLKKHKARPDQIEIGVETKINKGKPVTIYTAQKSDVVCAF